MLLVISSLASMLQLQFHYGSTSNLGSEHTSSPKGLSVLGVMIKVRKMK